MAGRASDRLISPAPSGRAPPVVKAAAEQPATADTTKRTLHNVYTESASAIKTV